MAELVSAEPQPVVYLIHDTNRGIYKIGCTRNIHVRFKVLSRTCHSLKHIHSIETQQEYLLENYWHKRFREKHVGREWFQLSEKDIKEFCSHEQMDVEAEAEAQLSLYVKESLHAQLKQYCTNHKVKIWDLVSALLEDFLAQEREEDA